jgi:osmotically inducible protein OsmC
VPRIRRQATVAWEGSLARGSGVVRADTSGAFSLPFTLASRVADPDGKTSPEELLAAAHACCYSTSLAGEVARAGGTVVHLDVTCEITMDEVEGGHHRIVASALDARGQVEGLDAEGFSRAAEEADRGCPVSALVRATASVSVRAQLQST